MDSTVCQALGVDVFDALQRLIICGVKSNSVITDKLIVPSKCHGDRENMIRQKYE